MNLLFANLHNINFICTKSRYKCLLLNDQRDAQFFSMYLFIFLTLYTFRAHRDHHQERQIVSIQPLVAVTLCRWPYRVQVGSWEDNIKLTVWYAGAYAPAYHTYREKVVL